VWWRESWGDVGPQTPWLGHPLSLNQAACAWWLQHSCPTAAHLGSPSPALTAMGWLLRSPSLSSWAGTAEAYGREPVLPTLLSFDSSTQYPLVPSSSRLKSFLRGCMVWLERSGFWSQLWIQTLLLLCPSWGILKDCLTAPSLSLCTCKMATLILVFQEVNDLMSLWLLAWCPPHSRLALIYFHWLEKSSQLLGLWVLLELRWGALWTNSGLQRSIRYLGRLKIAHALVPQLLVSLWVISHQINYTPQNGASMQITNTLAFSKGNEFEMAKKHSEFQT